MKYKILYTLLIFLAFNQLKAQETVPSKETEYVIPFDSLKGNDKMHYQFSTGAEMSFSKNHGSSTSLYYSPNVSYLVSPKLIVGGGMTYINSNVTNFNPIGDIRYKAFNGNISQYYTYITAKYKLNDKMIIGGSIFYNMTEFNSSVFTQNQHQSTFDKIGYSASFEYKLSDNTTIEAHIRINDTNNYGFGVSPFGNNGLGSNGFFQESSGVDFPYGR